MRVSGLILFGDDAEPFSGADANVLVEDTTYADARARRLASWRKEDVSYPRDASGVSFEIDVEPDPPENVRCTLKALVDIDRDGFAGRGDYMSVESIRLPRGGGSVEVPVKRMK